MSRRAIFFFLATVAALIMGFATGRGLWFNMGYLLAILLIASFVWSWVNLRGTKVSRSTRTRQAQVGQVFEERMVVNNSGWLPKLWLGVHDHSTLPGHSVSRVVNGLLPQKSFPWRVRTLARTRGRFQLGHLLLETSDPFGLFPLKRKLPSTSSVTVYPLLVNIRDFPLPQGVLSGGEAVRRRTFNITPNARSVRDYAPGDSFGRIHWKSTARRNRLVVKEFELDPQIDVWVIPDLCAADHATKAGYGREVRLVSTGSGENDELLPQLPPSTEEYVVTIAGSVAQCFIKQDRTVGMIGWGLARTVIQPDRGERQMGRIMDQLAVVRAMGTMPLDKVLPAESTRFQRGSTLIVVTPMTDVAWVTTARELERRGLRVVTVLVNPARFGGIESSRPLYTALQANKLAVYMVSEGDDITAVLASAQKR